MVVGSWNIALYSRNMLLTTLTDTNYAIDRLSGGRSFLNLFSGSHLMHYYRRNADPWAKNTQWMAFEPTNDQMSALDKFCSCPFVISICMNAVQFWMQRHIQSLNSIIKWKMAETSLSLAHGTELSMGHIFGKSHPASL